MADTIARRSNSLINDSATIDTHACEVCPDLARRADVSAAESEGAHARKKSIRVWVTAPGPGRTVRARSIVLCPKLIGVYRGGNPLDGGRGPFIGDHQTDSAGRPPDPDRNHRNSPQDGYRPGCTAQGPRPTRRTRAAGRTGSGTNGQIAALRVRLGAVRHGSRRVMRYHIGPASGVRRTLPGTAETSSQCGANAVSISSGRTLSGPLVKA